jgi:O-antigen ligase
MYSYYLALFPVAIILFPKLTALAIVLFVPILIIGIKHKKLFFKFNWLNLSFVVFYMLYLFYCMFTRHSDIASKYLEYKLSFILFPLIFSFKTKEIPIFKWIIISFISSSFVLAFLGFINSYECYSISKELLCWLTVSFSYLHHPSYASVYFTVAIFLIWYAKQKKIFPLAHLWAILLTFFFTVSIFLCLSLAGMSFLIGGTIIFLLMKIYQWKGKKYLIISTVLLPTLILSAVFLEPHVKGEFQSAIEEAQRYVKDPVKFIKTPSISGSDDRLIMWTVTGLAIQKYPMGVGTGNIDEILIYQLEQIEQHDLALKMYNPHNQYLQTWLEIGFLGLFILLFICFYVLKAGVQSRNYLMILLATNLLFNMLFESMLQRQSGIVFYTFALCLMVAYNQYFIQKQSINK